MPPIENNVKSDLQTFYIESVTKYTFGEIFSYQTRATKRLLRTVLRLAAEFNQRDHVHKCGAKDEVWIACIVPIMQGYWRSNVPERKKKKVLYDFHNKVGNIVFNDVYLGQSDSNEDALKLFDKKNMEFNEKLHQRIDEYVRATLAFLDGGRSNNMPKELIEALTHNLFGDPQSQNERNAKPIDGNLELFAEMLEVSVLMISAFGDCMRG